MHDNKNTPWGDLSELGDISAEAALSETDRELNVRFRCYERWIAEGKLSRIDARDRVRRLAKACQILQEASHADDLEAEQPQAQASGPAPQTRADAQG